MYVGKQPALGAEHPWIGRRTPEMLTESAARWPDEMAVADGSFRMTFRELRTAVDDVARNLRSAGVAEGEHVGFLLGESWRYVTLLYAVAQVGAVAVPLNVTWEAAEVARGLGTAEVDFLIVQASHRNGDLLPRLRKLGLDAFTDRDPRFPDLRRVWWHDERAPDSVPERDHLSTLFAPSSGPVPESDNQLAYVMFTSGSSAAPKAVLICHESALGVGHYASQRLEVQAGSAFLNISPFYHTGGLILGLANIHQSGATIRVTEGYQHESLMASMWEDESDYLIGFDVVTMRLVRGALEERGRVPFRKIVTGPGINVYDELTGLGIDVVIIYGMTELSNFAAMNRAGDPHEVMRDSNGWPIPGMVIRVVDPVTGAVMPAGEYGEIRARGWGVMLGYYQGAGNPVDLPLDDEGYFATGDYGYLDEQGRVYYRGRYSAMVKSGGENVSQAEVENFLMSQLPGVRQAAVVGIPDETWGEAVVAFIELDESVEFDPAAMKAGCRGNLAGYKIPKRFIRVPAGAWPVTPTGKIVKTSLVEQASAQASS